MEEKLIEVINNMLKLCEPIKYEDFNKILKAKNVDELRNYEILEPKVGLSKYGTAEEGISTLSIIATITDILIGKRLSFILDDDGFLTGVAFYGLNKMIKKEPWEDIDPAKQCHVYLR